MNDYLPPIDKLEIATAMAESLALLHGFPEGVIVHGDVYLAQFMLSRDRTTIKLNDFNRAEIMQWDDENQDYCKYQKVGLRGNVSGQTRCTVVCTCPAIVWIRSFFSSHKGVPLLSVT